MTRRSNKPSGLASWTYVIFHQTSFTPARAGGVSVIRASIEDHIVCEGTLDWGVGGVGLCITGGCNVKFYLIAESHGPAYQITTNLITAPKKEYQIMAPLRRSVRSFKIHLYSRNDFTPFTHGEKPVLCPHILHRLSRDPRIRYHCICPTRPSRTDRT